MSAPAPAASAALDILELLASRGEPVPATSIARSLGLPLGPLRLALIAVMALATGAAVAQTGLIAMIGKAERGPVAIEAIRKHKSAYLMAVGGAAYLVAKAIKKSRVAGFADLGMEAIYEFDVENMPVTVAVDSSGISVHNTGPKEWQIKIGKIPVSA